MSKTLRYYGMLVWSWVLIVGFVILTSCTVNQAPRFGVGGRYEEGRDQFLRGRGGDMDKAVVALEYVVSQDPTYKDSLTFLGRAYYRKGRYRDAYAILQRALAVNKDDEIAWLAIGLTQLRLGQNESGLESLKGGVTLASKVMIEGYHNYPYWDIKGTIRGAIRRTAFLLTKGLEEKDNIIQATDRMLALIDDEENFQKNTRRQNVRPDFGG
jgi:tetratricopeptide (TPR) repeat protein